MNLASCLEFILSYSVVFEEQCRRAFPYITLWGSIPSLSLPPPRQLPLIDQHTTLHYLKSITITSLKHFTFWFQIFYSYHSGEQKERSKLFGETPEPTSTRYLRRKQRMLRGSRRGDSFGRARGVQRRNRNTPHDT